MAGRKRLGFEIKLTTAPGASASARTALADLSLDRVDVVHAGAETYELADRIRALSMARLLVDLKPLS
jgi:hypothetical protein